MREAAKMTKQEAIDIFGSRGEIAKALNLTRAAISMWPNELPTRQRDQIVGAAIRQGKNVPARFLVASSPDEKQPAAA